MSFSINNSVLGSQYPNGWNEQNPTAAYFTSEDSNYRVFTPTTHLEADGSWSVGLRQDHIRKGARDDRADIGATFTADGELVSTDISWYLGGNNKIPDNVVKAATDLVKAGAVVADIIAAMALEPELIPEIEEAAKELVDYITKLCNAFNKLSNFILTKADDGGRMNFIAVVCHDLNKLCCSVNATKAPTSNLTFDAEKFANGMWMSWGNGKIIKNEPNCMEYDAVVNTKKQTATYRVWRQDVSIMPPNEQELSIGLLISTKIDHQRGYPHDDDHAIVLLAFNTAGKLIMGQASVQFSGEESVIIDPIYTYSDDWGSAISYGVAQAVKAGMKPKYGGSNDGRQHLPTIISDNIYQIYQAVSVTH